MQRPIAYVLVGVVVAIVAGAAGAFLFVAYGGVPMAATSSPLPLEARIAHLALRASYRHALNLKNPLPVSDENLVGGADVYTGNCAICHGALGQPKPDLAANMFPPPPQLLVPADMVTTDPEGEIYWKITNGIRLSGMPAFEKILPENRRWQVTMLLARADRLTPAARRKLLGD